MITTFALELSHDGELLGGIQQFKQKRYIQAFGGYFSTVFLLIVGVGAIISMTVPKFTLCQILFLSSKIRTIGTFVGKGLAGGEGKGLF